MNFLTGPKEKGIVNIPILVAVIALIGFVFVSSSADFKDNLFAQLFPDKPKSQASGGEPQTGFTLKRTAPQDTIGVGGTLEVNLLVRSDRAAANLFDAKINFNKDLVALEQIDYTGSFITSWVEQFSDNNTGTISLVGGVANPGLQTQVGDNPIMMAKLIFKVLKEGNKAVSFKEGAMYSNADNNRMNIDLIGLPETILFGDPSPSTPEAKICATVITLACEIANPDNCKDFPSSCLPDGWVVNRSPAKTSPCNGIGDVNQDGYITYADRDLILKAATSEVKLDAEQTKRADVNVINSINSTDVLLVLLYIDGDKDTFPACTSLPIPEQSPLLGNGDANKDDVINLVDLSALLSDFNKKDGFRAGIDLNGDGVINTFDFSMLRDLLIANRIIKG